MEETNSEQEYEQLKKQLEYIQNEESKLLQNLTIVRSQTPTNQPPESPVVISLGTGTFKFDAINEEEVEESLTTSPVKKHNFRRSDSQLA